MSEKHRDNQKIICFVILLIYIPYVYISCNLENVNDTVFFYNRVKNLSQCIRDGIFPYFYYNDMKGTGYGTSFFYGQLTLLPFIPFEGLGYSAFSSVAQVLITLLTFFSASFFARRFSNNEYYIGLLMIMSQSFVCNPLIANKLAFGISCFFLAKCVDFFRDKKSFIPASLLFYLIINTHLMSTMLSFFCCVIIFLYYFDKNRFNDYFKFAAVTGVFCSYFLVNMKYHSEGLNLLNFVIFENPSVFKEISQLYNIPMPFLGLLIRFPLRFLFNVNVNNVVGVALMPISLLIVGIINIKITKPSYNKKQIFLFVFSLCLFLLGILDLWLTPAIYNITRYVQFPVRLDLFINLFLYVFLFRNIHIKFNFIYVVILLDLIICSPCLYFIDETTSAYFEYVANGEYFSHNFNFNVKEFDELRVKAINQDNEELDYYLDKDVLVVNVPEHDGDWKIQVPKLYYKTYVCDEGFECYEGYSQFVTLDIGDYSGDLHIHYEHPLFLKIWSVLSYILVIITLLYYIFYKNFARLRKKLLSDY